MNLKNSIFFYFEFKNTWIFFAVSLHETKNIFI